MSFLQASILGIIQGLTEFLPVSSSAHLVLAPAYLNWHFSESEAFIFDVLVQWGTLAAVIIYFWKDLRAIFFAAVSSLRSRNLEDKDARLAWLIVIASIPAAIIGFLVRDAIQSVFIQPAIAGWLLLATAGLLVMAELLGKRMRDLDKLSLLDALIIGLFQAFSLLPGISRSGSTIAGAMIRNIDRASAARFSFLMSVPVMMGAGLFALTELGQFSDLSAFAGPLIVGFIFSALVGYFAIKWLLNFVANRSFYPFAIYCTLLGFISIWLFA